ncbi:MAG: helix-turn-helix domain-containing protein [Vicinamibacterales bacterium]
MNPDSSSDARVSLRARFRTATREAILEAAATLLGGDAASQTRMEDIAAQAGIAVGTVYNYFEDRTALVRALLASRSETLLSELDAALEQASRGRSATGASAATPAAAFTSQLTRFVSTLVAHIDANRFLFAVLHEDEHRRGIDAQSASRRQTVLGEVHARAARLMERGIKARALRKGDPAIFGALLVGMVKATAQSTLQRQQAMSSEGTATILRIFMTGAAR